MYTSIRAHRVLSLMAMIVAGACGLASDKQASPTSTDALDPTADNGGTDNGGVNNNVTNPNNGTNGACGTQPAGQSCTCQFTDSSCTAINCTCDLSCYNSTSCLINCTSAGPGSTPTCNTGDGTLNGCGGFSCSPEDDYSQTMSCSAVDCPPPAPPQVDPPVQPSECGTGMDCKPGSTRYCDCDHPTVTVCTEFTEWTLSTCDVTGHWGPCEPTAPLTNDGCDANDYSPELCCPPLGLCCQDNPDGPFKDFGSGACAAITC